MAHLHMKRSIAIHTAVACLSVASVACETSAPPPGDVTGEVPQPAPVAEALGPDGPAQVDLDCAHWGSRMMRGIFRVSNSPVVALTWESTRLLLFDG